MSESEERKRSMVMDYQADYQEFHAAHPKKLPGKLPKEQIQIIGDLVRALQLGLGPSITATPPSVRLLDYGSGKGYQYLSARIHDTWGGILPFCYDPGVIQLGIKPKGKFNGIICTDVMEHIEKDDLPIILDDLFDSLVTDAPAFVYFHVCCRSAHKSFPDGRNLHRTVEMPEFWERVFKSYRKAFPSATIKSTYELPAPEAVEEKGNE